MSIDVRAIIEELRTLRRQDRVQDLSFWQAYAERVRVLCLAEVAAVFGSSAEQHDPLRCLASQPADSTLARWDGAWLGQMMERAASNQFAVSPPSQDSEGMARVLVRLEASFQAFLLLLIAPAEVPRLNEILLRAQLVADIPASGICATEQAPSMAGPELLALLDLIPGIYSAKHFSTAAYALVNSLVTHSSQIDQAVLGWRDGHYVRTQAISHFDRFEKRAELVKCLEAAMEESADQSQAIYYDNAELQDPNTIILAHHQLKVQTGCHTAFSIPLGDAASEHGDAVLLLISHRGGFSEPLREAVHFIAQLLLPRLCQLKEQNDGVLRRSVRAARRGLGRLFGPEHLGAKAFTLLMAGLLLYSLFGTLAHRIEGTATLTTDSIRVISAPFDGQIERSQVTVGDRVAAKDLLAVMDIQELLLQSSEAQADLQRFQSEVNRARANMKLIETEIAGARVAQTQARLSRLDVYLQQARLVAPLDGVIVEGQRQELFGLPVSKGQLLYRIARIEGMYLRIEVRQEDIHFIHPGDRGEFVFVSQPGRSLPFTVTRVIPLAQVKEGVGAVFELWGEFDQTAEDWWRPGMSGVAKVDQGRKQVLWVVGHKLMNRLRLWLWS